MLLRLSVSRIADADRDRRPVAKIAASITIPPALAIIVDIRPPYGAGIKRAQLGIVEGQYPERRNEHT
jgi:hypothetical protein